MHIPDGYLAPAVSLGLGALTVPAWYAATRRVQAVLSHRLVPLLAVFAALSFTIMMFNVPVPGGTTAHAVGGTLVAIVLGPWAAVIAVTTALVIQALFFGDGGILAIFANCLNMAVVLPFVGYATYRLLAGRSPTLSPRRAWAAAIGGYAGITAAALAVGIELGVEPLWFSQHGHALYSPYTLQQAVPAMLVSHLFGASIVEGFVTGLGVAYFQQRHPEYLAARQPARPSEAADAGDGAPRPPWQLVAGATVATAALLAVLGLATGGGDPARLFGTDWSQVGWPDVATMLLLVAILGAVLVPLAYRLLPPGFRRTGAAFTALAVVAPLGLVAPGFAYGEGGAEDVEAAFGYVPQGLRDLSGLFSAPLGDYNVPLPFFDGANAPLWHAALGYEITGITGILLVGGAALGLGRLLGLRRPTAPGEAGSSA